MDSIFFNLYKTVEVGNKYRKKISIFLGNGRRCDKGRIMKGKKETEDNGSVYYFSHCDGYLGLYKCHTLSNCTVKYVKFIVHQLQLKKAAKNI